MNTITIQVPEGWLTLTREEYEAHLVPAAGAQVKWLSAKQMEEVTGISARRWIERAKRGEIPHIPVGDRSYRFDLQKVQEHLSVEPESRAATGPMKELLQSLG